MVRQKRFKIHSDDFCSHLMKIQHKSVSKLTVMTTYKRISPTGGQLIRASCTGIILLSQCKIYKRSHT